MTPEFYTIPINQEEPSFLIFLRKNAESEEKNAKEIIISLAKDYIINNSHNDQILKTKLELVKKTVLSAFSEIKKDRLRFDKETKFQKSKQDESYGHDFRDFSENLARTVSSVKNILVSTSKEELDQWYGR